MPPKVDSRVILKRAPPEKMRLEDVIFRHEHQTSIQPPSIRVQYEEDRQLQLRLANDPHAASKSLQQAKSENEPRVPSSSRTQDAKGKDAQQRPEGIPELVLPTAYDPPARTDFNNQGDEVTLRTNYFELIPNVRKLVYKYICTIEPLNPKIETPKRIRRRLFHLLLEHEELSSQIVATNYEDAIFTTVSIPSISGPTTLEVEWKDEVDEKRQKVTVYKIMVELDQNVPISDLVGYLKSPLESGFSEKESTLASLQSIMTTPPNSNEALVTIGKRFYEWPYYPNASQRLGDSDLLALPGFYASVRTSTQRILLNVNACTSTFFPSINLKDFIKVIQKSSERNAETFIQRLRIQTSYLKNWQGDQVEKIRTVQHVYTKDSALTRVIFEFKGQDGKAVKETLAESFIRQHRPKHDLKNFLPIINISTMKEPNLVPADACTIVRKQIFKGKLTVLETQKMVKNAARYPGRNAQLICDEGLEVLKVDSLRGLSHFGLVPSQEMITVPGRVLTSPSIAYSNTSKAPFGGLWNMEETQFQKGGAVRNLFLFLERVPDSELEDTSKEVQNVDIEQVEKEMRKCGMRVDAEVKIDDRIFVAQIQDHSSIKAEMPKDLAHGGQQPKLSQPSTAKQPPSSEPSTSGQKAKSNKSSKKNKSSKNIQPSQTSQPSKANISSQAIQPPKGTHPSQGVQESDNDQSPETDDPFEKQITARGINFTNIDDQFYYISQEFIKFEEQAAQKARKLEEEAAFRAQEKADGWVQAPSKGSKKAGKQRETLSENQDGENVEYKPAKRFVLVILPKNSPELYSQVKYLGDIKYGIHTVCCVGGKLKSHRGLFRQMQYCANLALKFNLKAEGINWELRKPGILGPGNAMMVGIDVTHPGSGSVAGAPSIAAVVASTEATYNQFPGCFRVQTVPKEEMVEHLEDMFLSRLELYEKRNGVLPDRIFVYRDGVSEGQYPTVLKEEKPRIEAACRRAYGEEPDDQPKIVIIVVGKRHHTRFFPMREQDCDSDKDPNDPKDRRSLGVTTGNPKPGTVVDRGVTMEKGWDFFLQPHKCIQGTARPAHYIVLLNTFTDLSSRKLIEITHNLCYLFPRATRAVSICPPAYYADLLCDRARCYLNQVYNPDSAADRNFTDRQREEMDRGVHPDLKDTMYYI